MTEPTPILDTYEAYGCRVNSISVEELFRRYEEAGFLYPEKKSQLRPFWDLVVGSWRAGVRGGELILWFSTFEDKRDPFTWGSISSWRSTHSGWNTQHLVSVGSPAAAGSAMFAGQAVRIRDGFDRSHQNWFQPSKKLPMRIFGSLIETIGPQFASVTTLNYCAVPLDAGSTDESCAIVPWSAAQREQLVALATAVRGRVYATAEELEHEDGLLEQVDELYRKVGLRRYRRIWLAYLRGRDEPVAAIIAYRGPLGFNFSFLENRLDLLVRPEVSDADAFAAIRSLVAAAAPTYADFAPGRLLITCDDRSRLMLEKLGGQFIRQYAQSIWLKEGYIGCYRHVEKFYARVMKAEHRRGLGIRRAATLSEGNDMSAKPQPTNQP